MFLNGGRLYSNAVRASKSITSELNAGGQVEALMAVIFAALSLETFINEVRPVAELSIEPDTTEASRLQMLAGALTELEAQKASTQTKYLIATLIIAGVPLDKTKVVYVNFKKLIELRNHIIHQKAFEEMREDAAGGISIEKRKLEPFRSKGLLATSPFNEIEGVNSNTILMNWLDEISTKAMAIWACNSASGMVNSFLDAIPQGRFRLKMDTAYRSSFQPISKDASSRETTEGGLNVT
jgi:hypothetical protein